MGQALCPTLCGPKLKQAKDSPATNEERTRLFLTDGVHNSRLALPPQQVVQLHPSPQQCCDSVPVAVAASSTAASGSSAATRSKGSSSSEPIQLLAELPGRRRSLLVGINYYGTSSQLHGCVNDIRRVREALAQSWGFPEDDASQRVLLDEPGWPNESRPTLSNMRAAIAWLVEGARTGDALYFHYSGHGGREPKRCGEDGYHETLCPVDYESAGMLVDIEMFEALVRPLPAGCRLTCVLDCCHSAGALDLPYVFVGSKENLDKALAGEALDMAVSRSWARDVALLEQGRSEALLGDLASMGLGLWELYKRRQSASATGFAGSEAAENMGLAVGEVVAFTGCRSDQTSADVGNVHEQFHMGEATCASLRDHAGGALTAVLLESLGSAHCELSYLQLLERMRERLRAEGFEQVPQLASSLLLELGQRFSLSTAFVPPAPGKARSGFDATDGALVAGGAACAAGFLAALAASPHGTPLLREACSHDGSAPYHEAEFGQGGSLLERWHRLYEEDAPHNEGEATALCAWGEAAIPHEHVEETSTLHVWGEVAPQQEEKIAAGATPPLGAWGNNDILIGDPIVTGGVAMQGWGAADAASEDDEREEELSCDMASGDEFEDADEGGSGCENLVGDYDGYDSEEL